MFFYLIAGVKIVKLVLNRGRQVTPIAPFFSKKKKHHIDHHIHLQSFQVHIKAEVFNLLVFGCVDFPVLGPDILQLVVNLEESQGSCGKSSLFEFLLVCQPWHFFSPRSMLITMTESNNIGEKV